MPLKPLTPISDNSAPFAESDKERIIAAFHSREPIQIKESNIVRSFRVNQYVPEKAAGIKYIQCELEEVKASDT